MELSDGFRITTQEVFVSHANAALTPRARLRLARLIVEEGWPVARAAERFAVSWPTANRWAQRYRLAGEAGMTDRSSRPHRCPLRTPAPVVRKVVHLRWHQRLGPVAIARTVGVAPSTAHRILVRCRLNRLSVLDRRTGEPIRRYEHAVPGDLLHADVKMLGNIPDGGGWRFVGRVQGDRNRFATPGKPRNAHRNPQLGHGFVHVVPDDHSRVAYAEIHDDQTAATAIGVLRRAVEWLVARGVRPVRILTDNGSCYRGKAWKNACAELGIRPKHTRPYRPQTNGKVERFNRTLAHEWAFARQYSSELARSKALPGWLHAYNHHRIHTAIGGHPPISRLTNLPGHYT